MKIVGMIVVIEQRTMITDPYAAKCTFCGQHFEDDMCPNGHERGGLVTRSTKKVKFANKNQAN